MANISLDYDLERQNLLRKQAIAEALYQRATTPGQMPLQGAVQAKINPLALLFKGLTAKGYYDDMQKAEDRQKDLSVKYASESEAGLRSIVDAMSGKSSGSGPMADPNAAFQTKTPKDAILEAMVSPISEVRSMGMELFKGMREGSISAKDALGHFDPTSVIKYPGNPEMWQPKHEFMNAGDFGLVDTSSGKPTSVDLGPIQTEAIGGDLYQVYPNGKRVKLDNAAKVNVTQVGSGAGETAYSKAFGEVTGKAHADLLGQVPEAQRTLALAADLEKLNMTAPEGPGAPASQFLAQLATELGLRVNASGMVAGEKMQALLSKEISKYLTAGGGVGRSMTDEDRKRIEQQWPQLANSRAGRQEIINQMKFFAEGVLDQARQIQEGLKETMPEMSRLYTLGATPGRAAAPQSISASSTTSLPTAAEAPQGAVGFDPDTNSWVMQNGDHIPR